MITNAISQPYALAIKGIVTGADNAPTVAPALKILVANALSFLGKYSAVDFIAAGKLPASPNANTKRAKMKSETEVEVTMAALSNVAIASFAPSNPTNQLPVRIPDVPIPQSAWIQAPTDQIPMAQRKPFLGIHPVNKLAGKLTLILHRK